MNATEKKGAQTVSGGGPGQTRFLGCGEKKKGTPGLRRDKKGVLRGPKNKQPEEGGKSNQKNPGGQRGGGVGVYDAVQ